MVMFWVAILAVSILLYVLLDGFDLGVGILFGLARDETRRHAMLSAVAPMWDGNETWLVVAGVILWGAFPIVYATLFSAFYLPLLLMLAGLILRGVAFEYRYKTERMRWIWDSGFAGGSLVAAFMQGLTVGALVEGLPITNGYYSGGEFGWFSPFAVLCGIGLCLGYSLLGACWLVMLLIAWIGSYLIHKERIEKTRLLLWLTFLSFPLPFIAILTGWYTAEVGRQPWTVYGVLRTADAMTPFLTAPTALTSLVVFCAVYSFIFAFGTYYIHRLLHAGPAGRLVLPPAAAIPNRPMSVADEHHLTPAARRAAAGE